MYRDEETVSCSAGKATEKFLFKWVCPLITAVLTFQIL